MSTEAVRHVMNHFPKGGKEMLTMLVLAHLSKDRYDPFTADATFAEVAMLLRTNRDTAKARCDELEESGYLAIKRVQGRGRKTHFHLRIRYPIPKATKRKPKERAVKPKNIVQFAVEL